MAEQIAIVGFGTIGPWGTGLDRLAEMLESGSIPVTSLPYANGTSPRPTPAGSLVPAEAWQGVLPMIKARRLSMPARFAVAAAAQARAEAGLENEAPDPETGVALATAFGPASFTERLLDQLEEGSAEDVSPAIFSECVANAAAAQVALFAGFGGPSITVCQREAGPAIAFDRAQKFLKTGRARRMFVGTSDQITPLLLLILNRFRSTTRNFEEGAVRASPFAESRDGFFPAEGAAMAVLEGETSVRARGAKPLGWLRAVIRSFDPDAPRSGYPQNAERLAHSLREGLKRESIEPASIEAVVSGASGSRTGDATEAEILQRIWPDGVPALHAPKARVGEYGGGQLSAAWLLLSRGKHAVDYGPADFRNLPGLAWAGRSARAPKRLLISSLAAGGAAAWMVLDTERPTG